MAGRPPAITTEIVERVCRDVARGAPLTAALQDSGASTSSWYRWLSMEGEIYDQLRDNYARAREQRGEHYGARVAQVAERCEAGEIDPNAARVAIDGYKWTAARMAPKNWGDASKFDITSGGQPIGPAAVLVVPPVATLADWSQMAAQLRAKTHAPRELIDATVVDDADAGGDEAQSDP